MRFFNYHPMPFILIVALLSIFFQAKASDTVFPLQRWQEEKPRLSLWDDIRQGFKIPNIQTKRVDYYTRQYIQYKKDLIRTLQRAKPYLHYIVQQLHQQGLPTELAFVPIVESNFNPLAYSPAHAAGLWQFIPQTAQHYQLGRSRFIDSRHDIIRSTGAALSYLAEIHQHYEDWYLTLAAYNWGQGSVSRAMRKNKRRNKSTEYIHLDLPKETRNYIPKLQALENILSEPEKYDLELPDIPNYDFFRTLTLPEPIDMRTAAELSGLSFEQIFWLNPSFKFPVIFNLAADQPTQLLLPAANIDLFQFNLALHMAQKKPLSQWKIIYLDHRTRASYLSKKHKITLSALLRANNIASKKDQWLQGRIVVPTQNANLRDLKRIPQAHQVVRHRVRHGDTLGKLAARYGTSTRALKKLNRLKNSTIYVNQSLLIKKSARFSSPPSNIY